MILVLALQVSFLGIAVRGSNRFTAIGDCRINKLQIQPGDFPALTTGGRPPRSGIDSGQGIARRVAESLSLREFPGCGLKAVCFNVGLLVRENHGMGKPQGLGRGLDAVVGCAIVLAVLDAAWLEELGAQETAAASAGRGAGRFEPAAGKGASPTGCKAKTAKTVLKLPSACAELEAEHYDAQEEKR